MGSDHRISPIDRQERKYEIFRALVLSSSFSMALAVGTSGMTTMGSMSTMKSMDETTMGSTMKSMDETTMGGSTMTWESMDESTRTYYKYRCSNGVGKAIDYDNGESYGKMQCCRECMPGYH